MIIPQFQTPEQAASSLHIDSDTLMGLVHSGQLVAYYFPNDGFRFNPEDVHREFTRQLLQTPISSNGLEYEIEPGVKQTTRRFSW